MVFCFAAVSSVKSRTGPDSVPSSFPPSVSLSSRPGTPSKPMDTAGSDPTPSKYKVVPDPSLRKGISQGFIQRVGTPG